MFNSSAHPYIRGSEKFRYVSIHEEVVKQVDYVSLRTHIHGELGIDIGEEASHYNYATFWDVIPKQLLLPERTLTSGHLGGE